MKAFILCVEMLIIHSIVKCSGGAVKRENFVATWLMDENPKPFEISEKQPSNTERIESVQEEAHDTKIQKLKEDIEHLKAIAGNRKQRNTLFIRIT